MKEQLKQLFTRYADAFVSNDADLISTFYQFPMTFFDESGATHRFDAEQFITNSRSLLSVYQTLGVSTVDFDLLSVQEMNGALCLASVQWHFSDQHAVLIYSATTRYLVQASDLAVIAIFVVDESSQLSDLTS